MSTPTIYVDPLFRMESRDPQAFRVGARHGHLWAHLWCDGPVNELHKFAKRIGLRREWFQDKDGFPHYDLVPPRWRSAVRKGAVVMSLRDYKSGKRAKPTTPPQQSELGI